MGTFQVDCEVASTRTPSQSVKVPGLLVDTGSTLTWIPSAALRKAGIRVAKRAQAFQMANGKKIRRSIGYAFLRAAGFETVFFQMGSQPFVMLKPVITASTLCVKRIPYTPSVDWSFPAPTSCALS